jgi:hypothetical protein
LIRTTHDLGSANLPQQFIIVNLSPFQSLSFDFIAHFRERIFHIFVLKGQGKGKGKAVPLQAWNGPEGSRKLRFADYMTTAQDGGKVVSLTHRPLLPPGNAPGTYFF